MKRQRKVLLTVIFSLFMLFSVFGATTMAFAAPSPVWTVGTYSQKYEFRSTFDVPDASITVGDKTVSASYVVKYPSGKSTSFDNITLSEGGWYTVSYTAMVDGEGYLLEKTFLVEDKSVVFDSSDTSIEYAKYYYASTTGLMVDLDAGDKIAFSELIDLSSSTKNDVLFEGFAAPTAKGSADFRTLIITLTDAVNPESYVNIKIEGPSDNLDVSYVTGAPNNQKYAGRNTATTVNETGALITHSFRNATQPDVNCIRISYDASENACYIVPNEGSGSPRIICDFDDSAYFPDAWNGFTTGLVKMTVTAKNNVNDKNAQFCITEVAGKTLTDVNFKDTEAPEIYVDSYYAYTSMPIAKKGTKYLVPEAFAYDFYAGDCEVSTRVWFGYESANRVTVKVTDGYFTPDRVGTYTIVYEALDNYDNLARFTVPVTVVNEVANPTIDIVGAKVTELNVGDAIMPLAYDVICNSGDAIVEKTITFDGQVTELENSGFKVERPGTYTVKYTVTDYIGQTATAEYNVTVGIADYDVWIYDEIDLEYNISSKFNVPSVMLYAQGKSVEATVTLTDPADEEVVFEEDACVLSSSGYYTLTFKGTINEQEYTLTQVFLVKDNAANFKLGTNSSVSYGKYTYAELPGLMVRLAQGDEMTITQLIDVSNATLADTLIELFATPDKTGTADFSMLYVTFTDALNPNIYVRYKIAQGYNANAKNRSHITAAGNGQPYVGMGDKIYVSNLYNMGMSSGHDFMCTDEKISYKRVWLSYDAKEKSTYSSINPDAGAGSRRIICDFDDPTYFTSTLWNGFPSGKVKVSFKADQYAGITANFCISKLAGVDLTSTEFVDFDSPIISVDKNIDTTNPPSAEVGKAYTIPTATAVDEYYGTCNVSAKVWYNYGLQDSKEMTVTDGKFTPDVAGTYTIVYETQDNYDNVSLYELVVTAYADVASPSLVFVDQPSTTMKTGERLMPINYNIDYCNGNAKVNMTISDGNTVYVLTNAGYLFTHTGSYTVKYTVTDYIGQTSETTYDVVVEIGENYVFEELPYLPKTLISGYEYEMPEVYVSDYSSGTREYKLANATVTDKNGTKTVEMGKTFTPEVENNGDKVTITFEYGGKTYSQEISTIIAWSGKRLQLKNYFITDGVTVGFSSDRANVNLTEANGSWEFANDFLAENFSLTIKGAGEEKSNFEKMIITLTDIYDADAKVEIVLINNGDSTEIKVGDTTVKYLETFKEGAEFVLGYSEGYITKNTELVFEIEEFVNGEPFTGFASDNVLLDVEVVNASTGAGYYVLNVGGQPMTSSTTDRVKPRVVIYGDYGGMHDIGEVYTLPKINVCDVIDPNSIMSISVYTGSDKPVTAKDGTVLLNVGWKPYQFEFTEFGEYKVIVMSSDKGGNKLNFSFALIVDDDIAPEFTFGCDFQKTAKVGDLLIIPDYYVTDNLTDTKDIIVKQFIITPNGQHTSIPLTSNSVKAVQDGVYTFELVAYDASNNMTVIRKSIKVTR